MKTTILALATLTDDVIRVDAPGHPLVHDKLFEAVDWDEDVADGTYSTMVTYEYVAQTEKVPAGLRVSFDQDPIKIS